MSLRIANEKIVYDITEIPPFFVFFPSREIKDLFISEYEKKNSCIFCETNGVKRIYTDAYVFVMDKYRVKDKKTEKIDEESTIGMFLNAYPITQVQTLEAVKRGIQIVGFDKKYFLLVWEKPANIEINGADKFWTDISKLQQKKDDILQNIPRKDIEISEEQARFLDEQIEIIKAKREFDKSNLLKIEYSQFGDVTQNVLEGVNYKFLVKDRDNKCVEDKVKLNVPVEVSVNDGGRCMRGTLVEYKDNTIIIKFQKDISSNRIAKYGEIKEVENVEYNLKINAFERLKRGISANKYLVDVICSGKCRPYVQHIQYDNDKDVAGNPLNSMQKDAIVKALNVEDFLLVQGPPGTGKTTIITEMILNFVKQGLRVLICSKNNLAVDNVLEKCMDLYYDEEKSKKIQCLRLGNEENIKVESVKKKISRRLSLEIQDNVKLESEKARAIYVSETDIINKKYVRAEEVTKIICEQLGKLISLKEEYELFLARFNKCGLKFFISKDNKDRFINNISCMLINIHNYMHELIGLLRISEINIEYNKILTLKKYLEYSILALEYLQSEITRHKVRFRLIFGKEIHLIKQRLVDDKQQLRILANKIVELQGYKGNPVARELKCFNVMETSINYNVVKQYEKEISDVIRVAKKKLGILKSTLDEWHNVLESDDEGLEKPLLQTVKIIGATCIGTCTNPNFKDAVYDVAIVDEAGQIGLHDVIVPLEKAKKVILIGDHLQLPPMEDNDFCNYLEEEKLLRFETSSSKAEIDKYREEIKRRFSVSLFEELFVKFEKNENSDERNGINNNFTMLDTQFRMHPDIAAFVSKEFYKNKYRSGVTSEKRQLKIAGFDKPIYFVDTNALDKKKEEYNESQESYSNSCEAKVCAQYLVKIIKAIEDGDYEMSGGQKKLKIKELNGSEKYDIGVITAYKAQIDSLRTALITLLKLDFRDEFVQEIMSRITINTLDSFQGRDNQIIFYSFVRSNDRNGIGFQNEVRRLNVLMTRAKSLLVMVGDSETLMHTKAKVVHEDKYAREFFSKLIDYCKEKEGYIDCTKEQ